MDETLEVERCREIEAELRGVALKARFYGRTSTGLLVAAALIEWMPSGAEPDKFAWSFLCFGLLSGVQWIIFVVEANRAKVELSLHLAKCHVLAQGRTISRQIG